MTKRLKIISSLIGKGEVLADVGCDHGIIAYTALKQKNFNRVIISDISAKSLEKARLLLKEFGASVKAIVCDGFCGYDEVPSVAVIAGMGGEEIYKILSSAPQIPNKLVLSPQKNSYLVRKFLVDNGYNPVCDYTIKDGKFYDIIVAEKGSASYTENELLFGQDNIKHPSDEFIEKIKKESNFYNLLIKSGKLNDESLNEIKEKLQKNYEVLNEGK